MPTLVSRVDPGAAAFRANADAVSALLQRVRELERRVRERSDSRRPEFERRRQLLPRERVAFLLDKGSPFLELSTLAGLRMHDDDGEREVLGGALVTGIGYVAGARCAITASDSAIRGGTISPMTLRKQLRCQQIARENKLPLVYLIESGGANLLYQAESFVEGGQLFCNQARLSAAGIPQITVVHGSSTAGGAYLPGLSDHVIMVRDRAKVFLAGPPLLKAATGEVATSEDLGGALMHASVSGVADYLAEDDADGIRIAREVVGRLRWSERAPASPARAHRPPRHDPAELLGIAPADYRRPCDVREVIARVVDGSELLEFKELYGSDTICGVAEIEGFPVGIVGNNGPLDAAGSCKAAQFIQLMCQADTPILYLQNITGYMVGTAAERAGIVKHGSKMIQAVANATVPQLTLHLGASFGAGNYGMCGRAFGPRFIFAWPTNRIAVMGGEQAGRVMTIVNTEKALRAGKQPDTAALEREERRIVEQFGAESTALYATARLWDDGVIDPRDTRKVLAYCLSICREAAARTLSPNTFGVARM